MMTSEQRKPARTMSNVGAVGVGLAMVFAFAPSAMAQTAAASDADVVVKGAVDHYDSEDHARKPETAAQVEAKKKYSPYAGRKFPTRVFFGDTHHHTANSGDAFMAGDRLTPRAGVPLRARRRGDLLHRRAGQTVAPAGLSWWSPTTPRAWG